MLLLPSFEGFLWLYSHCYFFVDFLSFCGFYLFCGSFLTVQVTISSYLSYLATFLLILTIFNFTFSLFINSALKFWIRLSSREHVFFSFLKSSPMSRVLWPYTRTFTLNATKKLIKIICLKNWTLLLCWACVLRV